MQKIRHASEAVKKLILKAFQGCEADIFLFGSRAIGEETRISDYDIGYYTDDKLKASLILSLKEDLEELPIQNNVDLVDFKKVPDEFRKMVFEGEIVIWKKRLKNSLFI